MRLEQRLKSAARRLGIPFETVLKDYAIGHLLSAIALRPDLARSLVMKGGTALRKLWFGDYRFSEDLDFSAMGGPRGHDLEDALQEVVASARETLSAGGPFDLVLERLALRDAHPRGQECFAFRVQFPWQRSPLCLVKLEVTTDEPVLLAVRSLRILHGYDEDVSGTIRAYCLEEIVAEKLRALLQSETRRAERGWARPRCRDLYDLWNILSGPLSAFDRSAVRRILPAKCAVRGVSFESPADFFPAGLLDIVRTGWEGDLGPFVRDLPAADEVIEGVRREVESLLESG